ncbi:MAG: signal transduction histidine kinase [Cognaticolwellia sp.]|jgi:signal transduction histidine kinase
MREDSWERLSVVGLSSPTDAVLARTRVVQICEVMGAAQLRRTCLASAVSQAARSVVADGKGRVELWGRASPPAARARFRVGSKVPFDMELLGELTRAKRTADGLELELDLPQAEITPHELRHIGAHLAQVRSGFGASASLVQENRALLGTLEDLDRETRRSGQLASRLAQRSADLELFASAASHDLREPIVVVNLYAQLLLGALDRGDLAAARQATETIQGSMGHAQAMLEGLSAFGRLGELDEGAGSCQLDPVLRGLKQVFSARVEERGGRLEVQTDLPAVGVPAEHMAQVLQNLIANSIKFSDGPPVVQIHASLKPDGVHLSVQDQGIGIPEKHQARVFELFSRAHPDRPGTGLGLALVTRIVQACGGRVSLESTAGQGTCITLILPAA